MDVDKYILLMKKDQLGYTLLNQLFLEALFKDALVPNGSNYTLDMTKLSNVFTNGISMNSAYNQEWLSLGFRLRKSMWSFSINEKLKSRVLLPQDFFRLVFEGNGGDNVGEVFDLGFGVDFIHTREFAVGYSRSYIDDKLRIGGRIKYIASFDPRIRGST